MILQREISMCSGSKRKPTQTGIVMDTDSQKQDVFCYNFSILLELTAADDLDGFGKAIEEEGHDIDEPSLWYGRMIGSRKMGFVERTPLMIASMFGSKDVVGYIINSGRVDVNRPCGLDGLTALHCVASGGSANAVEVAKLLLDASADVNSVDAYGNQPADLIAKNCTLGLNSRNKVLEALLKGSGRIEEIDSLCDKVEERGQPEISTPQALKDGGGKKEYPFDPTLPDIKNGIYGTDEFRMYTFKVEPCSRAYSHDWTECPFVHPGENARRRDPRKYHYSCVPCPEFRKGSCRQGDACEYAHGIFECWLHPAQYRTRLCKDETKCSRKVCFFAHKPEELRPLYATTGSAVPSPRSFTSLDMSISPRTLGSPSAMITPNSTPPLTPSESSAPMGGAMWNQPPPTLQLSGSRLKSARNARNMNYDRELLGLDYRHREQQLIDEVSILSSPSSWATAASYSSSLDQSGELNGLGGMKRTNIDDIFGSLDPTTLQGLSLDTSASQLQSPTCIQMRQNLNQQLHSSYPTSSSPVTSSQSFGIDLSGATADLSLRSAAFAKRSPSFIEQNAVGHHSGFSSPASATALLPSNLADWGSPDGKLDWGFQREELNKLHKSSSFNFESNRGSVAMSDSSAADEPDLSWVLSVVRDTPSVKSGQFGFKEQQCHLNTSGSDILPAWLEQLCVEQEQLVA